MLDTLKQRYPINSSRRSLKDDAIISSSTWFQSLHMCRKNKNLRQSRWLFWYGHLSWWPHKLMFLDNTSGFRYGWFSGRSNKSLCSKREVTEHTFSLCSILQYPCTYLVEFLGVSLSSFLPRFISMWGSRYKETILGHGFTWNESKGHLRMLSRLNSLLFTFLQLRKLYLV